MPPAASAFQPHRLPIDALVSDLQDFGMLGQQELAQDVVLERAEAAAESDVVGRGDLLVADDDDVVIEQRLVDGVELLVVVGP